jgi:dCTP deaminase
VLSGFEILRQIALGAIVIDPMIPADDVGPNSVDLRLGDRLLVYEAQMAYLDNLPEYAPTPKLVHGDWQYQAHMILDTRKRNATRDLWIPPEGLVLVPGVLYLGGTVEHTSTVGFVPRIDGRSSVARLGLCVHLTAGLGDVNFRGHWTLEITCMSPVRVYAGDRFAQIYYEEVQGEIRPYAGKYQGAKEVQASLKHLDRENAVSSTED